MNRAITSQLVQAYSQCARKAFLLAHGQKGSPHEYAQLVEEQEVAERDVYRKSKMKETSGLLSAADLAAGLELLVDAAISVEGLDAHFDALKRVPNPSSSGSTRYEPEMFVGSGKIDRTKVIGLAYLGHVLGLLQHQRPAAGTGTVPTELMIGVVRCIYWPPARWHEMR